ncbi:MAG: hypothetical protein KAV00_11960 [Phycisphaerae bacterium]|nr:hypothetical protein [Phycisphaerae bacterium]
MFQGWNFSNWLSTFLAALLGLLSWFTVGCGSQATELERFSDKLFVEVIGPAVEKAIAETSTRTATLQGGAQCIEPGYRIELEGFWGTGVKAYSEIRVVGVSGQLVGHAQGDSEGKRQEAIGKRRRVEPALQDERGVEPKRVVGG